MRKYVFILLAAIAFPSIVLSQVASTSTPNATSAVVVEEVNTIEAISTMSYEEIAPAEEEYFAKQGKYLQVLAGNRLPHYERGTVAQKLGQNIPADAHVDIYEGPHGKGFMIRYTKDGMVYSVGYGPEAKTLTYSYKIQTGEASTTPQIIPELFTGTSTNATSTSL